MSEPGTKVEIRQYRELLARYVKPQLGRVAVLAALLLGSIGLQLFAPQVLRRFIDLATSGSELRDLVRLALLFGAVALTQQAASVASAYFSERVAWAATNALRSDLVRHCLDLDMSFHNAHTPGEMIERVDGDVDALSGFFSTLAVQIMGNLVLLAGVLVLLFREDWLAGAAMTAFSAVALSVMFSVRNLTVPAWQETSEAAADVFGFLEERLAGTEDLRSLNAKPYVMRRFFELTRTWYRKTLRSSLMTAVFHNSAEFTFAAGSAVALAIAAYLFLRGSITIGTTYLLFHYSTMLTNPIQSLTGHLEVLQRAGGSFVRILDLLQIQPRVQEGNGATIPDGALSVDFDDVSFEYAEGVPVLRSVSFELQPGKVLGLLGRTGSGKSTVTRLLTRLYDPASGTVRLGGADVRQAPISALRRRVGMVTQDVQLFHGTVRDNLTFFDGTHSDDRLLEVIGELGLGCWFSALPSGLDSVLSPDGGGLSAGEAQLLAFARVFLKDPGLVVLDEATSRLDRDTERRIERAVDRLAEGRTVILIAHHLATVQRADEVMILEEGQVLERGGRRELEDDTHSRYHALLQAGLEEVLA